MRYSIIVPEYNAGLTLCRCLDSIVNQAFSDYELLLINDGSTDGSDAICRRYAEIYPQIRYFTKENSGVSSARNLGLEQARGKYVLFVDSDDYVSEDYFESISSNIRRYDPDLLMFGYNNFDEEKLAAIKPNIFFTQSEIPTAYQVSSVMKDCLFGSLWNKVFRRDIIRQFQLYFANELSIGEDLLFIFSYAMHIQSIASVKNHLYNVDISDENSLSRKARPYLTQQLMEVNRRMYAAYQAVPHTLEAAKYYEAALSWMTYRSVYSCCKELLKFQYTPAQRRKEIRKICDQYRAERIKPLGWKCRVIALPVQMKWSLLIDWLICHQNK